MPAQRNLVGVDLARTYFPGGEAPLNGGNQAFADSRHAFPEIPWRPLRRLLNLILAALAAWRTR